MISWYYRCEVKGIQAFVMRGRKLREVVGGSALIESMFSSEEELGHEVSLLHIAKNESLGSEAHKVKVVYCAAGGATLSFEDDPNGELLNRWVSYWPIYVDENLHGLQLVQASVSAHEDQPVKALAARLSVARNHSSIALPRSTPVLDQGIRGGIATTTKDFGGGDKQLADLTSYSQLKAAEQSSPLLSRLNERFLDEEARSAKMRLPRDHQDISGDTGHYLAVIHIDGNGVGRLVREFSKMDRFADFSQSLGQATLKAVKTACYTALREENKDVMLGRPIVVGGDDVTAIVRADRALDFTKAFILEFEKQTQGLAEQQALQGLLGSAQCLTASAGIAFVRSSHPFYEAARLAEALCHKAKQAWKNHQDHRGEQSPSMIAFQRVTSSLAELDWPSSDGLKYRAGPYYLDEGAYANLAEELGYLCLDRLIDLVESTQNKEVSNGKLRTIVDLVSQVRSDGGESLNRFSPAQANAEWARVVQIHEEREQRKSDQFWTQGVMADLQSLGIARGSDDPHWAASPWGSVWQSRSSGGGEPSKWSRYGSPWLDVYELIGSGAVDMSEKGAEE